MNKPLLFCLALVVAMPSLAGRRSSTSTEPGSYKDWGGEIDSVEVVQKFSLASYGSVSVATLDTSDTPLPEKKDNTYEPVKNVLRNATEPFVNGLKKELREKNAKVSVSSGSAKSGLLVRARVVEMDPGSRAARYWAGFGAGAARTKIVGEIVDASTKKVLVRFEQERRSGVGAAGGDYESLLERNLRAIGKDIAMLLAAF